MLWRKAGFVCPGLPVYFFELFVPPTQLEIFLHSGFQLIPFNTLFLILMQIMLSKILKELLPNNPLNTSQKLKPLIIRNIRESIIRIIILDIGEQRGVIVGESVIEDGGVELPLLEIAGDVVEIVAVDQPVSPVLQEDRVPLIEPEMVPVAAGDQVASPRMRHLVDHNVSAGFVSDYDRRRGEGHMRVLHAAEGEAGR